MWLWMEKITGNQRENGFFKLIFPVLRTAASFRILSSEVRNKVNDISAASGET